MKKFIRENKEYLIFYLGLLFAGLLYSTFGHWIIRTVYETPNYQGMSLRQNLVLADKIAFLILACAAVCFLLHRLVFSQKKTSLLWFVLIFVSIIVFIYKLNPNSRIYSYHGFLHAAMVYKILNGEIPPSNALVAGKNLSYPWGYEYITARITDIFNITPFYAFAIISIISLAVCMMVIYKISRLLIKDNKANILSVIISLFGSTIFNLYLMRFLRRINILTESRGVPAWVKFSDISGLSLGLVFYLLFLYSVIRIFVDRRYGLMALLFFLSITGYYFVYPQFLPGIMASAVLICLVNIVWKRKENLGLYVRKSLLIIGLLIISTLILYPYISSISSGMKSHLQIFKLNSLLTNTKNYFVLCFPILLVIFLSRRSLGKNLDKRVLIIILTVIAATFCCYIFIHLPFASEYKFLILSVLTLGILGGVSLGALKQRWNKSIVFILLLLFMFPAFSNIYTKLRHYEHLYRYVEKGKYIYSKNTEENELYEWIRKETNTDDVFIDSEVMLPVLAQRPLFVAFDKKVKGRTTRLYPGYGFIWKFVRLVWGYDIDLVRKRNNIVYIIYSSNRSLTSKQKDELFASGSNVYVIVRRAIIKLAFNRQEFVEVFRSSQGNFLVYQCRMDE